MADRYPVTPDGRYFVVRGRLWRQSDPSLSDEARQKLVEALMWARRAVGVARRVGDRAAEEAARGAVGEAKRAWRARAGVVDGRTPDLNRHMARTTPYATWFEKLGHD